MSAAPAPSLLRTLVVRVTLVALASLAFALTVLYLEFHEGVFGIDERSLGVQAEVLAELGAPGPEELAERMPPTLRQIYSGRETSNGWEWLDGAGRVVGRGGYRAPDLGRPARTGSDAPTLQRGRDPATGRWVLAASVPVDGGWIRAVKRLDDLETLNSHLMLHATAELGWPLAFLLVALVTVIALTVKTTLEPLRAVSQEAAEIDAQALSRRLSTEGVPREILPLVAAVNDALRQLEEDYAAQRHFTAHAAHELRTPIATCRARLQADGIAVDARSLEVELAQLSRIVEQLLCLARVESAQAPPVTRLDAYAVARDVARSRAPAVLDAGQRIRANDGVAVPVDANEELLRIVFRNLIDNAILHAGSGATITLDSFRDGSVVVADDGRGVAPEDVATLFRRFGRGRRSVAPGAGLGLAITREIMRRLGGDVLWRESPRGATFVVRTASTAARPAPNVPGQGEGATSAALATTDSATT